MGCGAAAGRSIQETGGEQVSHQAQRLKNPKWSTVLDGIRACGYMSLLKVAQTTLTVVALPLGFSWHSQGLMTQLLVPCEWDSWLCSGLALALLCWMSYFFWSLVGTLYMNESGTMLQVAHLTSSDWRQKTYCPVVDVMPLMEIKDWPQQLFMRIQQCGGKQTFFLPSAVDTSWTERVSHRCFGC
ncbi:PREDICTED: transmembrane protein 186-like [Galeopterus variegatus]|uniref:Transmembrane protein 186 n=1 Tax=Galeopterus variegatus TaxID=482537 RepID=A0ABM0QZM5_GALVR|nr:PREDICTED: transmembrane protein 186-like [Galeopterus variegatus]